MYNNIHKEGKGLSFHVVRNTYQHTNRSNMMTSYRILSMFTSVKYTYNFINYYFILFRNFSERNAYVHQYRKKSKNGTVHQS